MAAVGAWIWVPTSGIEITGRSLSGIERSCGMPGLSSSSNGTRWISATSPGSDSRCASEPPQTTTGVITKPVTAEAVEAQLGGDYASKLTQKALLPK